MRERMMAVGSCSFHHKHANQGMQMTDEDHKASIFDVAVYVFNHLQRPPPLTQMRLYKILWFCQGWHYVIFEEPLFEEEFEAWKYGPVSRELWQIFLGNIDLVAEDFENLKTKFRANERNVGKESSKMIEEVLKTYGMTSAANLVHLTRQCIPWINYKDRPEGLQTIPKEEIKNYFMEMVQKGSNSEKVHPFVDRSVSCEPKSDKIVIELAPFINEMIFKGTQIRLRLIGSDFVLEKFHASSPLSLDEIVICNWTNKSIQKEWNKMSINVRKIVANGNPVVVSDLEYLQNYKSPPNSFALVNFPNCDIKFWKNDDETFTFELKYGYNTYCFGTTSKDALMDLRHSFLIIWNFIERDGKILDIREPSQVIDPQTDYVKGEDCLITAQLGGR